MNQPPTIDVGEIQALITNLRVTNPHHSEIERALQPYIEQQHLLSPDAERVLKEYIEEQLMMAQPAGAMVKDEVNDEYDPLDD